MDFSRQALTSSYGSERPKFFFWYPHGTSAAEKKLLFKIDFFILTYACFGYFAKWLDQANLSNAYVTGMKEDLGMYGNQLTIATTVFNVGVIIGGIPSNLLITLVPPRFWLPGCELLWALFTISTYKITSYNQLYALRFCLGLLEGTSFVGIQYVIGSWYKRNEIGKRTAIFTCAAYVGTAFGGYIQSGVKAGLDGVHGLASWRWVFIIDGIITVVIAIWGLVFFPDTPEKTTAFYLSAEEKQRCVDRLVEDDRMPMGQFSWSMFSRIVQSWQFYILAVLWMFWNTTVGKVGNTAFQLFLKDDREHTWSVYQVNNIPTAINGFNIVMILAFNIYTDATGRRMHMVLLNICILLFGTICLTVWNIPLGLRVVSYLFASCDGPLSPLFMAWANILCSKDKQVRALTLAVMNACGSAITLIIQQFLYPVTDAPTYKKGFPASLGFILGMLVWVFVVRYFELRASRKTLVEYEAEDCYGAETAGNTEAKGGVAIGIVKG